LTVWVVPILPSRRGGQTVDRYVAYEIDKYAIQSSTHNIPMIEHCGDVFTADFTAYEGIDLLAGGSPCVFWSSAKTKGRETEANGMGWDLFSQYARGLKEAKPKYFLYENNDSMSPTIKKAISDEFGFEPVMVDAALLTAQSRKRVYWCGIRQADGTYKKIVIPQPENMGILLKDILDICCEPINARPDGKSLTIKAQYSKTSPSNMLGGWNSSYGASGVAEYVGCRQVGALPRPNGELSTSQGLRIYDINGKSVTLKGNAGGAGGKTGLYAIPVQFDGDIPITAISAADGKEYPVYEVKNNKIDIKGRQYDIKLSDGFYIIRKLTVNECKKLQGIPDWYEFPVSDTRAYQQIGNGWCVPVIMHLMKYMFAEE